MAHDIYMEFLRPVVIMCCKFHTSATVGPTHDPLAHDIYDVFLRPLMIKHCKMHGSVVVVAPAIINIFTLAVEALGAGSRAREIQNNSDSRS